MPQPKNARALITLGAPFWGAGFASKSREGIMNVIAKAVKFPPKQLQELAAGSISLTNNRRAMLSRPDGAGGYRAPWPNDLHVYTMAGDLAEREDLNLANQAIRKSATSSTSTVGDLGPSSKL